MNDAGCLVHKTESHPELLISLSLKLQVLHLSHHPKIGEHSGGKILYLTIRRNFFSPASFISVSLYCLKSENRISKLVSVIQSAMEKARATYKRDIDATLRGRLPPDMKAEDYALICKEYYTWNGRNETRFCLLPTTHSA